MKAYLEDIITEEEASRDCATLSELYTQWKHGMTGASNAKKLEIDAAALEAIPGLPTDVGGLKVWYNFAKVQGDPDWGDDQPPNAELRWGEKLVKIIGAAEEALGIIYTRWNDGMQVITHYNEFRRLKGTYGTDLTRLRMETGDITREAVRDGIRNANTEVTQWLDGLNNFYKWAPNPQFVQNIKMYFAGQGFNRTTIDWTVFKDLMETNRGKVANMVLRRGAEAKTLDEFPEINEDVKRMSDILRDINQRIEPRRADPHPPRPPDRPVGEAPQEKFQRIRRTLRAELADQYTDLIGNYQDIDTRETRDLNLPEAETKTKLRITQGFLDTYEDLRKNASDWTNLERVQVTDFGELLHKNTFDCIMDMLNRVEKREEFFKDTGN